jgi:Dickkopf N-terminal cysteine-rich region
MIRVAVRSANTLSFAALVVCFAACGDDNAVKDDPNKLEPKAGSAAVSGSGSSGQTAGSGGTATAGRGEAGSAGRPAADGGKGGGAAGTARSSGSRAGSGGAGSGGTRGDAGMGGSSGAAGQGGSAGSDAPGKDVDVSEIAKSLAAAVCDAMKSCVGPAKLTMLTGREDCVHRYSAAFEQDDFGTLAKSVEAGWIAIDESKLDACYADTRALGCRVQSDRLPASCQEAIASKRQIGESCAIDADCAGAAYCPIDAECPRTCQATQDPGADCTRDAECRVGSVCSVGKCAVPAATDEACAGNSGGVCDLGASCVGSDDTTTGTCQPNANVQVGELDEACTPGMTLCKEGLSCAYDGAAFKCFGAVERGDACRLALPSQCPVDTYCSAADVTQTGSCLALPTEGMACVLSNACAGGHVCVTQGGKNTCRKLGDLGDACAANALCRSGACVAGACAIRPRCE